MQCVRAMSSTSGVTTLAEGGVPQGRRPFAGGWGAALAVSTLLALSCEQRAVQAPRDVAEIAGCYRLEVQAWHPDLGSVAGDSLTPPPLFRLEPARAGEAGWFEVWPPLGPDTAASVNRWQPRADDSLRIEWRSAGQIVEIDLRWDIELWRGTARLRRPESSEPPWSNVSVHEIPCDSLPTAPVP